MKKVYIMHPLMGDGSAEWGDPVKNFERYIRFCAWACSQGYCVISWAHHVEMANAGWSFDWLKMDAELLGAADEVWVAGPISVSKGMRFEAECARDFDTTMVHRDEWDDPNFFPEVLL